MEAAATQQGFRQHLPACWWLVGGALVVVFALQDLLLARGGVLPGGAYWGRDFINVWTGGQLIRQGDFATLYDVAAYAEYQRQLFGDVAAHNYSYPPATFPIAAVFGLLPYPLALAAWLVATGGLFVHAARSWLPRAAGPAWLAVVTPAALVNMWTGHYGFLLGALFLLGWQRLDTHPRRAGIFFGLMLIKPHLAVLVPLALLIRRDWQAIAAAAATVAALLAGTTLFYGWQPWSDFLFRTSGVQASLIDAKGASFGLISTSAATAALRLGSSWNAALALQAVAGTLAVAAVALAAKRAPTRDLALLVATATFLVLPYAFAYDLTVVAVASLVMFHAAGTHPLGRRAALYGFLGPQLGILLAILGIPGLPLILAALLAAQFHAALHRNAGSTHGRLLKIFGERRPA